MLVLVAHAESKRGNMHVPLAGEVRDRKFGLSLYPLTLFVYGSREFSGETAHMHMLA